MSELSAADPSSLLDEWKTAFFAIHKKNPRKADWLGKAPTAVKRELSLHYDLPSDSLICALNDFQLSLSLSQSVIF